ncbi:hypothetical protein HDV00_001934 [Rhizophlyctis rosea]|nr:hypothetical protein HDV00_001934 [Rhizophlyctis rosea]
MGDNQLVVDKHILFSLALPEVAADAFAHLQENFCGKVFNGGDISSFTSDLDPDTVVFFCGDVAEWKGHAFNRPINIIKELSRNYGSDERDHPYGTLVSIGEVPLNVHGVGVYFNQLFPYDSDYFSLLKEAHQFQTLTESTKQSPSFRKGIYLSAVQSSENGETRFNLLRCSTNLEGPTDGFKSIDLSIINSANAAAKLYFTNPAPLNHVLAQIYENSTTYTETSIKEKKARIKSHSDKTKDMPANGLIAFCTFYSRDIDSKARKMDYDYVFKNGSVLTKLRFRLKDCVADQPHLVKAFDVVLYPNSLFLIPLSTNRLYTHEIVPPSLPVDRLPTRLGYVIRCSKTRAVHVDGVAYIETDQGRIPMEKPTVDDIRELRSLYLAENTTADAVQYPSVITYSMNEGDYMRATV